MKISHPLSKILTVLSDKTKFETYIITFWYIALGMFNIIIYWWFLPSGNGAKMLLTVVATYISYNMIKTYTHTRTALEIE